MSAWSIFATGRRRTLAGLTLVFAALVLSAAGLVAEATASGSVRDRQAQRAARVPAGARSLGAPSASSQQSGEVALKPRDPSALAAYVNAVSTKNAAGYRDYLKPGQFAARFGPAQSTIDAVRSELTGAGLTVTGVSSSGMLVSFSGSTAQVESAFGTDLERFETATGTTGEETTSAIELPSTISDDVSGVVGLNTLVHPTTSLVRPSAASSSATPATTPAAPITSYPTGSPDPCSTATQTASTFGGLTDDEIANTYGAFGLYDAGDFGAGVHIGIYELEPYAKSDIQTFDDCYFGTPTGNAMVNDQLDTVPVDGGLSAGAGSGEAALDIEDVSAMAPGADIDVYEAPNTDAGALDEYTQMVDQDKDQIISSSWGECEQSLEAYEPGVQESEFYLFEQAAVQGQTVLAATGDTGSDGCNITRANPPSTTTQNPLSVWDPASQPDVIAVGGTQLSDADPANESESTWNDGATGGGGGGGISNAWAAPSWQQTADGFPTTTSADYANANSLETKDGWPTGFCNATTTVGQCRTVPDVSAAADPNTGGVTAYSTAFGGYSGAVDGGWYQLGGTSSATPIWAAMLALTDGSSTCSSIAPGENSGIQTGGIGFAAPMLYADADSSSYGTDFDDVQSGNNDIYSLNSGLTFPATADYDLATGLGSPRLTSTSGPGLAADLCSEATATSRPVINSFQDGNGNPTSAGSTAGGALQINGTGFCVTSSTCSSSDVHVTKVTVGSDVLSVGVHSASITPTSLTITLPPATATLPANAGTELDGAGPVQIVVTLSNGVSSTISSASTYDYVDENQTTGATQPSITSVSPTAGSESGTPTAVTIYGSGFSQSGDTVTFGGVAATGFTYVAPWEIQVTPPGYSSGPACATANALAQAYGYASATAASNTDLCQTQVQVSNAAGSATPVGKIAPMHEGTGTTTGFELYPQPSEFDYVPLPTITSVSTSTATPSTLASAYGGTVIKLTGTGLSAADLNWVNFGNASLASSQSVDITAEGGSYIDIVAPALSGSIGTAPSSLPVSVDSVTGLSNSQSVTYAGIPQFSGIALSGTGTGRTTYAGTSYAIAPDGGGSTLTLTGTGLSDVDSVSFINALSSAGTPSPSFRASSDTMLSAATASVAPSLQDTQVCTASACTTASASSLQILQYAAGNPAISSVSAASGSSGGGTTVTITGANLGCATQVYFGNTPAQSFTNAAVSGAACGSTTSITAVSPSGTPGTTVPVTVATVTTSADGFDTTTETGGSFAYNPLATQTVTSTNTVVTPGPTSTVTTPGPTTTVTTPGTTTTVTVTKTYDCKTVTKYKTKTVTKNVKVKVNGKYVTKKEKVKQKVPYKTQVCDLVKTTTSTAAAEHQAAEARLARLAAQRARAKAAARARAARAKAAARRGFSGR